MSDQPAEVPNRGLITASIMLATVMNSLDTTIANVALPHMAGSVSASADQITWVLTSYIVASAILTPMTGWLAGRFGRKSVFMVSIIGFTIASALCGAATSLTQIVLFRLLQGAFGAALVPLSQAVLMDVYPPEQQGPAMAIWGMGALLGPIVGPALGGWLTDAFSWRWVFYINVPLGALAATGVFSFIHGHRAPEKTPFDFTGFILLSITLASFQLFLDRGPDKAWLESPEIWIEMSTAAVALVLFIFHTMTAERPFLPIALLKDRNFATATMFGFFVGVMMFATLALLPPMLETLMGYPVVTTGLVTMPRGVGSLLSMFIVGRLINRVDARVMVGIGLVLSSVALLGMSQFDLAMDGRLVITMGLLQGVGIGLVFVPLTTLGFATLDNRYRADGAGVFTLMRNLGASVGISIMQALLTNNTQIVHARLVQGVRADNPNFPGGATQAAMSLGQPASLAALNGEITRQAGMVAYIDNFRLMFFLGILILPFLFFMRPPNRNSGGGGHIAIE
jgi:DHA2 family multidrug resistance protein